MHIPFEIMPHYHAAFSSVCRHVNHSLQQGQATLDITSLLACRPDHSIRETFLSFARGEYGCEVVTLDFDKKTSAAFENLNAWIARKTRGRIPRFVDTQMIDAQTRLAIFNAVYFYSHWEHPFPQQNTSPHRFGFPTPNRSKFQ